MSFFRIRWPAFFINKKRIKKNSVQKNEVIIKELLFVGFLGFLLFYTLALCSFDYQDNSFLQFSVNRHEIANRAGYFGTQVSALSFFLFGNAIYFFLFLLWGIFAHRITPRFVSNNRLCGLTLLPFIAATLLEANHGISFFAPSSIPSFHLGGFIGGTLWQIIAHYFGSVGGMIFLGAMLWVSVIWIAQYSLWEVFWCQCKAMAKGTGYLARLGINGGCWFSQTVFGKWLGLLREYAWQITHEDGVQESLQESLLVKASIGSVFELEKVDTTLWDELAILCNVQDGAKTVAPQTIVKEESLVTNESETERTVFTILRVVDARSCKKQKAVFSWNLVLVRNLVVQESFFTVIESHWKTILSKNNQSLFTENKEEVVLTPVEISYILPGVTIFETKKGSHKDASSFERELVERGVSLTEKLSQFGIFGKVTALKPGPVITCFEYLPEADSKLSKIIALEDDLAMALSALSIRILAPIPGRNVIGFEIANTERASVYLREIASSDTFKKTTARLPLMLGVDTGGNAVVEDLVSMPHLLVAGSTGSGKSVGMHAMLASLLCSKTPDELKLVLIDPKRLEFVAYTDIPHLLFPIITQPAVAAPVLKWIVEEMERRYELLAASGVRNIFDYQTQTKKTAELKTAMPFIVVMIDELADLMMVAGKEVELYITRIAQMARAAGIYLVIATQRPSVDVVTGLIKANFPSRIAFRVASKIDSRTILDSSGAEKLLGNGDLLFMHSSSSTLKRIHGAYVSEKEILALTSLLKAQRKPSYISLDEVLRKSAPGARQEKDELFDEVCSFLETTNEISISLLQRHYRIGFNRSARLIEQLEFAGMIAPAQGSKPRKVIRP